MSLFPTPPPGRRTGVRVDLFIALDRVAERAAQWPGRRQGLVLDIVTETYHRARRRWSLERHPLAADLPTTDWLHEEYDVPLVLVYRHKQYPKSAPILMPWRETEGGTEGARGTTSGGLVTGEVLARATRAWPQFAGQMLTVYDRLAYDGPKWTPITDPDD